MRRLLSLVLVWLLLLTTVAAAQDREFLSHEFPERLSGEHFVVYYTTAGQDAITPAEAQEYLKTAEGVYRRLVTEGGMRPPRVEPVPLVVMADFPGLGGAVSGGDLGYDLWLKMNPRRSSDFGLESVMAHEFFHVLQKSYSRTDLQPGWAIEGTATIAPFYALEGYVPDRVLLMQLSTYWSASERPLLDDKYQVSLFWYWLADQYGGIKFLDRLLGWAEYLGWEEATQLAAIQGGAPDNSTFDTLWRSFVMGMIEGKMPAKYQASAWLYPSRLLWSGQPVQFDRGDRRQGLDPVGRLYTYWEPLSLRPYTFTTVQVQTLGTSRTAELVVTGDSGSIEAYLIKPGPTMNEALSDYDMRPSYNKPGPVPYDPATVGAALPFGEPVRLDATQQQTTVVLLVRVGDWGDGGYALEVRPAAHDTAAPQYQPLARIGRNHTSPLSPPPLTTAELESLRAGRYLSRVTPIQSEPIRPATVLRGQWGSTRAFLNDREVTLPLPVKGAAYGESSFPLKAVTKLLGGTVSGNRFALGDAWAVATPGSNRLQEADGTHIIGAPILASGDELLASGTFFLSLGAYYTFNDEGYTIAVPVDPSGD